jgi:alpha-glucosidase
MKRSAVLFLALCCVEVRAAAIAGVENFSRNADGLTFTCKDHSQVRLLVLAPDLIRVRVAFEHSLPELDHSWAIEKTSWDAVRWDLREGADAFTLSTGEVEAVVKRDPLMIEFRDAKTHRPILSDQQPMARESNGTVAAAKKLGFDEHFYGLGEKASHLDKRRGQFTMWSSDTYAYKEGTDPIYQSIPFYLGLENGAAYGVFFDNSYRTHFDFGHTSQEYILFSAEGGELNYYFFWGPSIAKILGRYADLTGHMPLPPEWALGHQQSRYSYYPASVAEDVVRRYRADDLPLDVLHLDIHYMDGYRVFTFDPHRFPDPKGFTERMKEQGVKVVTIVDPGVKYQPPQAGQASYSVYEEGAAEGFFLKRQGGGAYIPEVWPGKAAFVDYTMPEARRWWGDLFHFYTDAGVAGIWTDMNEPADFADRTGEKSADVVSYDQGENSTHAKNRNLFALLMTRATYEGLARLRPDARPFVITRSGYAGIQRYSTMWTGDAPSTWESLAISVPMFEGLGLSGEPFVGGDIGGFVGNANGELLTRWYQVGVFTPFCRNHKEKESYDQEPWRFGPYYEDIIRRFLKLRYRMLPYLYTVLEDAHRTGMPVFRPLLLNFQQDRNVLNLDDEFMVGADVLVAPILRPAQTSRTVYLPKGRWFDIWTGKATPGGTTIRVDAPLETEPIFVRGGALLPLAPEMNYVGERPVSVLTLDLYPDNDGAAAGEWYEDDGVSSAYLRGVYRRTSLRMRRTGEAQRIELHAAEGSYRPGARRLEIRVPAADAATVSLDGASLARTSLSRMGERLAVTITDDGKAHTIVIQ